MKTTERKQRWRRSLGRRRRQRQNNAVHTVRLTMDVAIKWNVECIHGSYLYLSYDDSFFLFSTLFIFTYILDAVYSISIKVATNFSFFIIFLPLYMFVVGCCFYLHYTIRSCLAIEHYSTSRFVFSFSHIIYIKVNSSMNQFFLLIVK